MSMLRGRDGAAIIVAVGTIFILLTMGIRQSFGLFLQPYTAVLDIGRDSFAAAVAMQNIVWGLASPMFGALADRRGPAVAAFVGGCFYVLGMMVMALAGSGGMLTLAQCFVGMGMAGAGFSVILGAVGKVVSAERRSMALGVVTAAGSFGMFVIAPLAQLAISEWDARSAAWLLAGCAGLMLLAAPLLRLPASAPRAQSRHKSSDVLRAAMASRSYVLVFLGFFVCGFQVVFISTHLPAYVGDAGLPAVTAGYALAFIGLFNIFGTLFCGWVGDKMPKKNALAWFYLLRSLVIVLFLLAPLSSTSVVVFGAAIGFLWLGTVPLTSGLVAVFFGARHLSMLYGVVFLSHQVGSFFGAWLGGVLYEAFGSYDVVWGIAILLGVVAAVLHYPVRERADAPFAAKYA